jgi:hypothetical protein
MHRLASSSQTGSLVGEGGGLYPALVVMAFFFFPPFHETQKRRQKAKGTEDELKRLMLSYFT